MKQIRERYTKPIAVRCTQSSFDKLQVHLEAIRREQPDFFRIVIDDWIAIREGKLAPVQSIVYKEFLPGMK